MMFEAAIILIESIKATTLGLYRSAADATLNCDGDTGQIKMMNL